MSEPSRLNESDVKAVNTVFREITEIRVPEDYYLMAHTEPGVRLWSNDGYSPGVFVREDDFWMFVADYRERT